VVKELDYAIKGNSLQIRRDSDDENINFWWEGSECLGVVREHDLYKNIGDIYMCADFERVKVKVPIIFFGTEGFSARRDGRYLSNILI